MQVRVDGPGHEHGDHGAHGLPLPVEVVLGYVLQLAPRLQLLERNGRAVRGRDKRKAQRGRLDRKEGWERRKGRRKSDTGESLTKKKKKMIQRKNKYIIGTDR